MQGSKLFVGNLDYSVNNDQLKELFSKYGEVKEIKALKEEASGLLKCLVNQKLKKQRKNWTVSTLKDAP